MVIMKIKTKILDFLPTVALILWMIVNISTAFFYTSSSTLFYHVVNIGVNVIGEAQRILTKMKNDAEEHN